MSKVIINNQVMHISKLSGKLEHLYSISTSPIINPICQRRAKDELSICHYCFSIASITRFRKNLNEPLTKNYMLLSSELIPEDKIPFLNYGVMRFESHGDLGNITQARNYIRIAKRNPHCTFSIWTKNHGFLNKAIELEGKPNNLICGISSPYMNKPDHATAQKYSWCDFLFTVYNAEFAKENNINMNCPRKCINCMKCYTREIFKNKSGYMVINEVLKSESKNITVEGDK